MLIDVKGYSLLDFTHTPAAVLLLLSGSTPLSFITGIFKSASDARKSELFDSDLITPPVLSSQTCALSVSVPRDIWEVLFQNRGLPSQLLYSLDIFSPIQSGFNPACQ